MRNQSPTGVTFVYSGKPEGVNRASGVGLMISNKTYEALQIRQPVSDRIISARFSSKVRNITIIQSYAPTELADDNEKDKFYSRLNAVYGSTSRGDIVIVMGDLNAKVGVGNSFVKYVVGRHGVGVRN